MKCTTCKDPFIDPDLDCKNQCDQENPCENGGKCVEGEDGVSSENSPIYES